MSARQQQSGAMSPEQMAALQEQLAILQAERGDLNNALTDGLAGIRELAQRIAANDAAQKSITNEFIASGIALLGDVSAAASLRAAQKTGIICPDHIVSGKAVLPTGVLLNAKLTAANGNTMPLSVLGYLGDENGKPVWVSFNKAIPEFTKLNRGVVNGTGTQQDNERALEDGKLELGTKILMTFEAGKELAGTYAQRGQDGRLRTDPNLKEMNDVIASGSGHDSWSVSSREGSDYPRHVDYFRLKDGNYGWDHKDGSRGLAVVLQCG